MKRDNNIELLRALLMLGICVLHSITLGGHPNPWLSGPLLACVDGFVFISGYYGVRFSVRKILRLYALGFFCIVLGAVLSYRIFGAECLGGRTLADYVLRTFKNHWFLHAYVVMTMLAPMVDAVIDSARARGNLNLALPVLAPALALVFVWGGMTALPGVGRFVPASAGVTAYSGLTLLGVYAVARLYRAYGLQDRIRTKHLLLALPLLLLVAGPLGFCEYSTPTAVLLAMVAFALFKRLDCRLDLGWLSPSLFAVYFYHTFSHGNAWVKAALEMVIGWGVPLTLAYFVSGLLVFVACLLLDIPRRILFRLLRL